MTALPVLTCDAASCHADYTEQFCAEHPDHIIPITRDASFALSALEVDDDDPSECRRRYQEAEVQGAVYDLHQAVDPPACWDAQRAIVVRMMNVRGMTLREIVLALQVCESDVVRLVMRNLPKHLERHNVLDADEMICRGARPADIARATGLHRNSVAKLKRMRGDALRVRKLNRAP